MVKTYIGIDVGSVSVAVVLLNEDGTVLRSDYEKHAGEPEQVLRRLLDGYPVATSESYALTGSGAGRLGLGGRVLDPTVV